MTSAHDQVPAPPHDAVPLGDGGGDRLVQGGDVVVGHRAARRPVGGAHDGPPFQHQALHRPARPGPRRRRARPRPCRCRGRLATRDRVEGDPLADCGGRARWTRQVGVDEHPASTGSDHDRPLLKSAAAATRCSAGWDLVVDDRSPQPEPRRGRPGTSNPPPTNRTSMPRAVEGRHVPVDRRAEVGVAALPRARGAAGTAVVRAAVADRQVGQAHRRGPGVDHGAAPGVDPGGQAERPLAPLGHLGGHDQRGERHRA